MSCTGYISRTHRVVELTMVVSIYKGGRAGLANAYVAVLRHEQKE